MAELRIQTNNTFKVTEKRLHEVLAKNYQDYSICVHGIKGGYEPRKIIAEKIVATGLFYMGEGNNICMAGTVEPCGLVKERGTIEKARNYKFMNSTNEGLNVLVLIPTSFSIQDRTYYWGYPRRNDTGDYPIRQKDFTCLMQKMMDDLGYIPAPFIFGYVRYNPTTGAREYTINRNHISFLPIKQQEEIYEDIALTSPVHSGLSYQAFDVNNTDFFKRITDKHSHVIDFITNTASEYEDEYLTDPLKLKKINN